MDEQNKQPEQNKPEKKLSRTTLTFYIVGLFSVAIALILISYVAQSRADKQVENLSSQLTQQQTVAQGATQKVEDLQKQYDIQNTALDKVRKTLDSEQAATDVVGATEQRMEEREVYQYLAQIGMSPSTLTVLLSSVPTLPSIISQDAPPAETSAESSTAPQEKAQ